MTLSNDRPGLGVDTVRFAMSSLLAVVSAVWRVPWN